MRLLLLLFLLLATPAFAGDPCADHFRAGMAAYRRADAGIDTVETTLYAGLGWVTRAAVFARLEDRSARTSACQERARLIDDLAQIGAGLQQSRRQFELATALCLGENRRRAQANLDALRDSDAAWQDLTGYLLSFRDRCDSG
ncbi:MAG: hypothetical protein H6899_03235 [Rhodobacter sp.]|nr:hypothetical protein [Rhodobacter sp.]